MSVFTPDTRAEVRVLHSRRVPTTTERQARKPSETGPASPVVRDRG